MRGAILERWILLSTLTVPCCCSVVTAFLSTPLHAPRRFSGQRRNLAMMDPSDLISHAHHGSPTLEALMSTLYATGDVLLKPAHEHIQPIFGPPDPYLLSGKSIAPLNPNAFVDSGGTASSRNAFDIAEQITQGFDKAENAGLNVINPGKILQFDNILPGFKQSGHFLPQHVGPEETKDSLLVEMSTVAKLMRVVNALPMASLVYALVEFFLIRPGYDVYKEEVEDDPPGAVVEFLALTGTRLGFLSVIAVVCLGLFDK